MEEGWFGPVSIEGLTGDDLKEIYRTKESHKIQITYREFIIKFEVIRVSGSLIEDIELIKQHLAYCFNLTNNEIEMILVDWPSWIDRNLYVQIKNCLEKEVGEHFTLESEFNLNIDGTWLKIIGRPQRIQQETRVGTIDYESLCYFLGGVDTKKEREEMLSADYMSLLAIVINQAQQEQDEFIKNNLIKVIQSLVKFPGIKLNILVKKDNNICYIDEIIVLPEINNILESARLARKSLMPATKKTNPFSERLFRAKQTDSPLYRFAKSFVYNIKRKNIERQFHHLYSEEEYRRMDALARLFEADGDCAAVF